MSKTVYTCEIGIPDIIFDNGGEVLKLNMAQILTVIENEKYSYYILRHATMSKEMEEFFIVGSNFDIVLTHRKRNTTNGEYLEMKDQIERICNTTLIQYKKEVIQTEMETYSYVFRETK